MGYRVQSGDTLWGIAQRHGISLAALEKANPQLRNPNLIRAGEQLNLPGQKDTFEPPKAPRAKTSAYTVQPGDTMSSIAARSGVSLGALERANPQVSDPNLIQVGQRLNIPGGSGSPSSGRVSGGVQEVKGTNAASIAQKYLGRYETELQREGVTQPCDPSESCANFVSSMLEKAGKINFHTLGVADLNAKLRARGWHPVSLANAKPGDVWIVWSPSGEQHTELVASNKNGKVTLIGSNNNPDPNNQQINYDTYSANIGGSFILAPP